MDKNRFDGFTRQLAKRENRRQAIKTLFAGGAATAATVLAGGAAGAKVDCCPTGHPTLCGLTCTDTITDAHNCGGCGVTCPPGQHCYKSACESDTVVHCAVVGDCPSTPNECSTPTCKKGICGVTYAANGKKVTSQTAGDCQKNVCDGGGNIISIADNTDKPAATGECTTGACVNGVPQQNALPSGRKCTNGKCDGAGHCSGSTPACTVATDCPATGNECVARTCTNGVCGSANVASGTPLASQTLGDCHTVVCNGSGGTLTQIDNTDSPASTPCITGTCNAGVPTNSPVTAGTSCNGSGGVCDGIGTCVDCLTASTCPGTDTDCATRTCTNGVCGVTNAPAGTTTSNQTSGDCKKNVCDGNGQIVSQPDDTDTPASGVCTTGTCTAGVPSQPAASAGTACPGGVCDGNGACVQCVFPGNCPAGNECKQATCQNGTCGFSFVSLGIPCATGFCDGNGACVECINDNYCPTNGQDCVTSTCQNGICTPGSAPAGTPCSHGVCDGYNTCIGCVTPVDCADGVLPHATVTCTSGMCGYYCDPGWGDCNPGPDGCDTYLLNDPQHCGGCNQVCPALPNAVVICANGACGLASCNSGFLDCNGLLADGCEVNASSDANNCGMCGKVCGAGQSCVNGTCQ